MYNRYTGENDANYTPPTMNYIKVREQRRVETQDNLLKAGLWAMIARWLFK